MAQVSLTVNADRAFLLTAGLRAEVERAVLDVLEAALEVRKLATGNVRNDVRLIIRVGSHLVSYSLDLERQSATIWGAEPMRRAVA